MRLPTGRVSSSFSPSASRLDLSYLILDPLSKDGKAKSAYFLPPKSLIALSEAKVDGLLSQDYLDLELPLPLS